MNTLGIHFGLIPDDIDPQTMTQDDLDYYFFDRTGIKISLFELFRLQQYQIQPDNTSSKDTLELEKEERKFLEPQPKETLPYSKFCENKPKKKCEKSLKGNRNLLPLCPIVLKVKEKVKQMNKIEDKRRASPLVRLSSLGKDDFEPQIEPEAVYFSLASGPVNEETENSLSENSQFCESINSKNLQLDSEDNPSEKSNGPLLGSWHTETDIDSETMIFFKEIIEKAKTKSQKIISKQDE
jgi:hypothetical protein